MERPSHPSQESLIEASLICRHVYYVTVRLPAAQIDTNKAQLCTAELQNAIQTTILLFNCDETIVDALFKSLA